jgi:hypothetical protein
MIEFRTTIKPTEKEGLMSSLSATIIQATGTYNVQTEDYSRVVLIRIYFNTSDEVSRFIELIREKQLPINYWVVYENNKLRNHLSDQTNLLLSSNRKQY